MKWTFIKKLESDNLIMQIEKKWKIIFPEDFKKTIIHYNAGFPEPNTIDTERQKGKAFGELLDFNPASKKNILIHNELLKDKLPPNVYAFSMDAGGNYLCFDYRKNNYNPVVIRWDHEQKFIIEEGNLIIPDHKEEYEYYYLDFIANTFNETLKKLYGNIKDDIDTSGMETLWENFMTEEQLKKLNDIDLDKVNQRRLLKNLPPILKD